VGADAPERAPGEALAASSATTPLAEGAAPARQADAEAPSAAEAPKADALPRAFFAIERPFRLDQRVFPAERAVFLAQLKERTRWNQGGLGSLASPLPPVPGHPRPKVIIDVTAVRGPHGEAETQRALRRLLWGKVVDCYGLGAYRAPKLRGKVTLVLRVTAAGKVTSARPTSVGLAEPRSRGAGLANPDANAAADGNKNHAADDVVTCLADKTKLVELPKARALSQITVEIQVAPGDEPIPPPASLITPGIGSLDPGVLEGIVSASRGSFEACYRSALAYAPELWGRLAIRFHVTETGKLDEAFEAETSFPDERVTLCVLRAARALTFPKPAGGDMRFLVPLRFWSSRSPASDDAAPPAQEKSAQGRVDR